ncbi:probable inactive receptor kinase At1g27190 [Nymphaea colorata]|uniref:probable inactive receptor kinase At1g27190 n=1 Tax=Nymphaea colorata TaxID=210225 RepID=UPI00129D5626|nr:probable inactive receptor kinase At1g27190 [Nymphaea colorata]
MENTLIFRVSLVFLLASPMLLHVFSAEDDVRCLKGLSQALSDPDGNLNSWTFANSSVGFICNFNGVGCWNSRENRVLELRLSGMKLSGSIPDSLQYCSSMTSLDLSNNQFSGAIPAGVCKWLPYLVTLDLSNNRFSGPIPPELADCHFLNALMLSDNQLTGSIPSQLSQLNRLKKFSVANNMLSGSIPSTFAGFDSSWFSGNSKLCGDPLGSKCGGLGRTSMIIIIAAGVFGAFVSLLFGFFIRWWYFGGRKGGHGEVDGSGDGWVDRLRAHKLVHVFMFQKPIVKIKLADLMAATNNFDPENIILSNRTGTTYRALLYDGSALAIKRLPNCRLSEKQFRAEMARLGQLRHPNLVPLLGYCIVEEERLLVYKHMANGTMWSLLHGNGPMRPSEVDWATRLKIGIGAARGLAWLHHGCQPAFIHQNISATTVLLNEDYEARIMDFGLARLLGSSDNNLSTFIDGNFGDFGYIAPEYSSTLVASFKGDVYGFGVLLLELVTGQKPLDVSNADEGFKGNLVDWVNHLSAAGHLKDAIDKCLCDKGNDEEILQFLRIAFACVSPRPKERASMYQVYQLLKNIGESYDFSEHFDEFPMVVNKEDEDRLE